jgi:hypothetical protein
MNPPLSRPADFAISSSAAATPAVAPAPGARPLHRAPAPEPGDACHRQDRAFTAAMMRAIARGWENPPMIGVFTDRRPLSAPRLFEPVPHSSGCTSPASECADLVAVDGIAAGPSPGARPGPRLAAEGDQ